MALGIKRSTILCKVLESRFVSNFTGFGRKNLHFASIFNMPIKVMNRIRITFHSTNILKFIIIIIQSGDKLPSVDLYENTPATKVNIAEMTAGKKVIIFGVPGAFTPGCSKVFIIILFSCYFN